MRSIFLGQAAAARQALQSRKSGRRMFSKRHPMASPALAPAIDRRHPDCLNRFPTMQLAHSRSDVFGNEVGVFSESAACAFDAAAGLSGVSILAPGRGPIRPLSPGCVAPPSADL